MTCGRPSNLLSETWPRLHAAFEMFAQALHARLERGVRTTEDSVRYTLFSVLVAHLRLELFDIILEDAHPYIQKKLVDLTILPGDDRPGIAVEFKYNRGGTTNQARTRVAGALCNDMMRCAGLADERSRAFVVLVTDAEMHWYWTRHAEKYGTSIYSADDRWMLIDDKFIQSQPDTFRREIENRYEYSCEVATVFVAEAAADHYIRVFEIRDPARS